MTNYKAENNVIMKAEKYQDLQSTSWRSGKPMVLF